MRHLHPLPRPEEVAAPAATLFAGEERRVLYIEGDPSLEVIVAALEAWGLRVRAEREQEQAAAAPAEAVPPPAAAAPGAWETTRPSLPRVGRLENILSPLWLPIRRPIGANDPVTAFSWFGRAA